FRRCSRRKVVQMLTLSFLCFCVLPGDGLTTSSPLEHYWRGQEHVSNNVLWSSDGVGRPARYGPQVNGLRGTVTAILRKGERIQVRCALEWAGKGNYVFRKAEEPAVPLFWDADGKQIDSDASEGFFLPMDFIASETRGFELGLRVRVPAKAAFVAV